jgi:hypothetical protein
VKWQHNEVSGKSEKPISQHHVDCLIMESSILTLPIDFTSFDKRLRVVISEHNECNIGIMLKIFFPASPLLAEAGRLFHPLLPADTYDSARLMPLLNQDGCPAT